MAERASFGRLQDLTATERRSFFEVLGKLVARTKQLPPEWRGRAKR
jgi:hypothetical protein